MSELTPEQKEAELLKRAKDTPEVWKLATLLWIAIAPEPQTQGELDYIATNLQKFWERDMKHSFSPAMQEVEQVIKNLEGLASSHDQSPCTKDWMVNYLREQARLLKNLTMIAPASASQSETEKQMSAIPPMIDALNSVPSEAEKGVLAKMKTPIDSLNGHIFSGGNRIGHIMTAFLGGKADFTLASMFVKAFNAIYGKGE